MSTVGKTLFHALSMCLMVAGLLHVERAHSTQSSISGFSVQSDTPGQLVVMVNYYYGGERGPTAAIFATTESAVDSQEVPVYVGQGQASLVITASAAVPYAYTTTTIGFHMKATDGSGSVVASRVFPWNKTWTGQHLSQAVNPRNATCSQYAQTAIAQYTQAQAADCPNVGYPVWSNDFNHHYQWCLRVSDPDANAETSKRQQILTKCPVCVRYARTAVAQYMQSLALRTYCPNLGYPVWSEDFNHHYQWCMRVPQENLQAEELNRANVLKQCETRRGNRPYDCVGKCDDFGLPEFYGE